MKQKIIDWVLKSKRRHIVAATITVYVKIFFIWLGLPFAVILRLPISIAGAIVETFANAFSYALWWSKTWRKKLYFIKKTLGENND